MNDKEDQKSILFQFLHGTIKGFKNSAPIFYVKIPFNSYMVRLKEQTDTGNWKQVEALSIPTWYD